MKAADEVVWRSGAGRSARWARAAYWLRCLLAGLAGVLLWLGAGRAAWELAVRAEEYPRARLSIDAAASMIVLDRRGRTLWQAGSRAGEQRTWTPLVEMAPVAAQASLASEDHRFFEHSGVDPLGVIRALWLNLRSLRVAYGASTISMQLVRLLEPELDTRTFGGKLRQALHAARLERSSSKHEILEQYLNRAYYGNGAFGLAAAAQVYFGASAAALSPGQGAFLAALPRAPRAYDPYRNRTRAERRMRHILSRMRGLGWVSEETYQLALDTRLSLRRSRSAARARHFIDYLLVTLPEELRSGSRVQTTLDLALQAELEVATRRHLDNVGSRSVSQAGVIVIDNRSGDILAMVGSGDYEDSASDGAVNVTSIARRAGSTLKPFVYALALEQGDSPATLAYDVVLPGEANETYTADVRQHGFARYREALAGSYNLAAVHTLQKVGVQSLVDRLRLAGVSTLRDGEAHGLDLAIGDAEIRLLEYAGAFAAFGSEGRAVRPRAVRSLELPGSSGLSIADQGERRSLGTFGNAVAPASVFSPEVAYQIFDILSDADARRPMFGRTAPLELGFPVALKTGTTRGYTDNLAFGTTREYTVGAWAGNFDGTPTEAVMAMQGAAPLVRAAFVSLAALYGTPTSPERPAELSVRDVCSLSGERPGANCPGRKRESFTLRSAERFDHGPECSFHVPPSGAALGGRVRFPPELQPWAAAHGLSDASGHERSGSSALSIAYPASGSVFELDPHRPASAQIPPLQALPQAGVRYSIDGLPASRFEPAPGRHVVRAARGAQRAEAEIFFE